VNRQKKIEDLVLRKPNKTGHSAIIFKRLLPIHLGQLMGEGAVEEARALVKEFIQRWPDSPRLQKWAYVLEPGKARVIKGPPAPPWEQERAWLRQHAHEYSGQWIAILGDQLVVSDANLSKVLEAVKRTGRESEVSLHYQPDRPWPL
jgi:hypothetical protein